MLCMSICFKCDHSVVINLSADATGLKNIPLHVSMRFQPKDHDIVLNTCTNGQWDKEERHASPFKAGDHIDIRIRTCDHKFEVYANQTLFATFDYRQPLGSVSHVLVHGGITLNELRAGGHTIALPFDSRTPTFTIGRRLLVTGLTADKCDKFHINLRTANGDIAMHSDFRFGYKVVPSVQIVGIAGDCAQFATGRSVGGGRARRRITLGDG